MSGRFQALPVLYAALGAAVAGALQIVLPGRYVPEPLTSFREIVPLVVAAAFVATLVLSRWIRRNRVRLTLVFAACIASMIVLRVLLVSPVENQHYLTGWRLTPFGLANYQGWPAGAIIGKTVPSFDNYMLVWGWSFVGAAFLYVLSYLVIVLCVTFLPSALQDET